MPASEFFFALEFSSQGAPASLVEDLAAHVFKYVGCPREAMNGLTNALEQAVAKSAAGAHRRCDVQFRVANNSLDILVSANGGRVWQKSFEIS